jgi:hypothetical protein
MTSPSATSGPNANSSSSVFSAPCEFRRSSARPRRRASSSRTTGPRVTSSSAMAIARDRPARTGDGESPAGGDCPSPETGRAWASGGDRRRRPNQQRSRSVRRGRWSLSSGWAVRRRRRAPRRPRPARLLPPRRPRSGTRPRRSRGGPAYLGELLSTPRRTVVVDARCAGWGQVRTRGCSSWEPDEATEINVSCACAFHGDRMELPGG